MIDPLAEIVTLLQPSATLSKMVEGAGRWRLRRTDAGQPFYCVVLRGACRLTAAGHDPIDLNAGGFTTLSKERPKPTSRPATTGPIIAPPRPKPITRPVPAPGEGDGKLSAQSA